jgi:hypothetical protein
MSKTVLILVQLVADGNIASAYSGTHDTETLYLGQSSSEAGLKETFRRF